jgi:hypothetical protein
MPADLTRVAAVEELPPDARGSRRVLRLHAVGRNTSGGVEERASCGYRYQPDELRPDRPWATVTPSGRCALCDARDRSEPGASIDVRDARDVNGSRQRSDR